MTLAFKQIKESQKAEMDALTFTAKAAAQDAINAALAVAAAALNKAIGVALTLMPPKHKISSNPLINHSPCYA